VDKKEAVRNLKASEKKTEEILAERNWAQKLKSKVGSYFRKKRVAKKKQDEALARAHKSRVGSETKKVKKTRPKSKAKVKTTRSKKVMSQLKGALSDKEIARLQGKK